VESEEEMAADVREDQSETNVDAFDAAAEEWNNVTEITPQFGGTRDNDDDPVSVAVSPLVTMEIVTTHLANATNMEQYLEQLRPSRSRRGVRRWLCCLRSPPSLPPHLRQTVRLVQATALIAFSNEEPLHLSMLRTIYRQLTSTTIDCPRYGSHWEQIGFQGSDPSTDLRGVGVLGLVQAIYLVTTPEVAPFSRDLYTLSRSEGQEFPLMVLSLNITRIALHSLRDGLLNKFIVVDEQVWDTFNFYYACLLYHVYITWKTKRLTIKDCGPLLQTTEELARARANTLISNFEKFLSNQYSVAVKQAAREQIFKYSQQSSVGVMVINAAM